MYSEDDYALIARGLGFSSSVLAGGNFASSTSRAFMQAYVVTNANLET